MTHRNARSSTWLRTILSAAGILFWVSVAIVSGLHVLAQPQQSVNPEFDVASIRPSNPSHVGAQMFFRGETFTAVTVTLKDLIALAYDVRRDLIFGGPSWNDSEKYDVSAKTGPAGSSTQAKLMLQSLLEDRFRLKLHRETRDLPIYALLISKNGPKVREVGALGKGIRPGKGQLAGYGVPLSLLASVLSDQLGRSVVDRTGLTAYYDFMMEWSADDAQPLAPDAPPGGDSTRPSIFTAIQEQLGLRLEAQKGPVDVLVIDSAARVSDN
jgi:uncharacterized protein (TIGR03435 family)